MPTINDVARQAGVSPATVSRVIRGEFNVHPATRERVVLAIQELGYVPSAIAQSLRSKRTRSLALVVPDITNAFWTTIARGVEDVALRHDYSVLLCNTDENLGKQLRYLSLLISQQVDGVIIAPYDSDATHLDGLRQRSIPTVIVDRRVEGWEVDSVIGDSLSGARELVRLLIRLGHRRIGMISGPATTSTAEDRVAGYCLALAEAGIPLDPRLIRRGEYRKASGEELTHQIFEEGLEPTAIFAANNAIAMGTLDALEKRGLRIPHDVALVCFDDLPNASHFFPFLTVVAQPAYDMGVNAAQLLLSRLKSEVSLRPRHVILPVRLIVRHSCGSQLAQGNHCPLSLPVSREGLGPSTMVTPLSPEERHRALGHPAGATAPGSSGSGQLAHGDKADVHRLLEALRHREADRVPQVELQMASKRVYEYVLERELGSPDTRPGGNGQVITPEDHVHFALRLGLDAVPCHFSWAPGNSQLDDLEPPPSLADQLSLLERYLRTARGTGVGIIASFPSFLDNALRAAGNADARQQFRENRPLLEQWMDALLEHQERLIRVVCDRFASELALVAVNETIADQAGLTMDPETLAEVFTPRVRRLIAPAQEHGKLLLICTRGRVGGALSILYDIGFDAVYPLDTELNNTPELKEKWAGKLAFLGTVPARLLVHGAEEEIEEKVRESCVRLAPGGGFVFGSSEGIGDLPPQNLVTMVRAVHKYGRYGSLGQEAPSPTRFVSSR